jgi:hypothetical protein
MMMMVALGYDDDGGLTLGSDDDDGGLTLGSDDDGLAVGSNDGLALGSDDDGSTWF